MKSNAKFAEWLKAYGAPAVARDLKVTERTAYYWMRGTVKPGPDNLKKILAMAPDLTLNDVLGIHGGRA